MKSRFKDENGAGLIMVLVVMMVLSILGVAILNVSLAEVRFSENQEDKLQAYYIARAGAQSVAELIIQQQDLDDFKFVSGTSSSNVVNYAGGSFQVNVKDEGSKKYTIESVGTFGTINQTVNVQLTENSTIFDHAITGLDGISSNNAASHADITGTVGMLTGSTITGSHFEINPPVGVDDVTYYDPTALVIPEIIVPLDSDPNVQVIGGSGVITSSMTIALSNNEIYIKAKGINLKNDDITVTGKGVLHLFVDGNVDFDKSKVDIKDNATKVYLYSLKDETAPIETRTLHFNGFNSTLGEFVVYAPYSIVYFDTGQSVSFTGSVIAKQVVNHNHLTVIYEKNIFDNILVNKDGIGLKFSGYRWVD